MGLSSCIWVRLTNGDGFLEQRGRRTVVLDPAFWDVLNVPRPEWMPPNPSLERTPPRGEFMFAVGKRRRSARDR